MTSANRRNKMVRKILEDHYGSLTSEKCVQDIENYYAPFMAEPKRVKKLPAGSLAFKVTSGMPIDKQDVEEYKVVKKWKHRDQIPEVMLPLADKAQERFGSPKKPELFYWMGEISEWMGAGATVADFMKTAIAENSWSQPATKISGYTNTIKAFAKKRNMKRSKDANDDHSSAPTDEDRKRAEKIKARRAGNL